MTIQRKSLVCKRKLPTATAFENRMQIFGPKNERPDFNDRSMIIIEDGVPKRVVRHSQYAEEIVLEHTDDFLGSIQVLRIELTQAHRDLLETIFTYWEHNGGYHEGREVSYEFTRAQLLKRLGKTDCVQNYQWLELMFQDLRDVVLRAMVVNQRTKDKRRTLWADFGILNSYEYVTTDFGDSKQTVYTVTFNATYLNMFHYGISLWYPDFVPLITAQTYGPMKALIRYCFANAFVGRGEEDGERQGIPLEDLFARINITPEKQSASYVSHLKAKFKNEEVITRLWDYFRIKVVWEGNRCEVSYDKKELDAAFPRGVTQLNLAQRAQPRIKPRQLTSQKSAEDIEAMPKPKSKAKTKAKTNRLSDIEKADQILATAIAKTANRPKTYDVMSMEEINALPRTERELMDMGYGMKSERDYILYAQKIGRKLP